MIKFFRKIRFDLIEKNKTGKYLKYAIGEIILVVIGILIALQINNWNETRKTRVLELSILEEIQQALVQDTLVINANIEYLLDKNLKSQELIAHIENKKPYKKRLDTLMMDLYYHRGYKTFNISAFDLLKENGFGIIKNDTLRKQITKHYNSDLSDIIGVFDRLEQINLIQGSNVYQNFKVAYGLIQTYDYQELLDNPKIFAPFYHFDTMNKAYYAGLTRFKSKIIVVLQSINSELEKRRKRI
jgi:hypothetical protein